MEQREKTRLKNMDILGNYLTIVYVYTILLVILIFLSLSSPSQAESNNYTDVASDHKELLEKVSMVSVEAYRNFSVDLLSEYLSIVKDDEHGTGVEGMSPFGVAYMLSVLHEKIWTVPTTGFDSALHLKEENIHGSYKEIIEHVSNDSQMYIHSNIYTSTKGLETKKNLEDLKTQISYINYNGGNTNEAIMDMNNMISAQTFGKIYDRLIPLGGWYGAPLYNYTQGVFINTLYFQSEWVYPFYSIGEKRFGSGTSKFLEAVGNFPVHRHKSFTAVKIPLKQSGKSLVLIQPKKMLGKTIEKFVKENMRDFLKEDNFKLPEEEESHVHSKLHQIKLQIPAFNFSHFSTFSETLVHLGISELMCMYKPEFNNTVEAVAQSFYGHIAEDKFEVAAATGSNLNNVDRFFKTHHQASEDHELNDDEDIIATTTTLPDVEYDYAEGISTDLPQTESPLVENTTSTSDSDKPVEARSNSSPNPSPSSPAPAPVVTLELDRIPVVKKKSKAKPKESAIIATKNKTESEIVRPSNSVVSHNGDKVTKKDTTVIFDTPFLWYFQDDSVGLGPLLLGTVQSAPKGSEEVIEPPPPGFEWLLEAQKFIFWSCPDAAYLSQFSSANLTITGEAIEGLDDDDDDDDLEDDLDFSTE